MTEAGGEAAVIQRVEEDTFMGRGSRFWPGPASLESCAWGRRGRPAQQSSILRHPACAIRAHAVVPKIERLDRASVAKGSGTFSRVFTGRDGGDEPWRWLCGDTTLQKAGGDALLAGIGGGREGIEELETQTTQLLTSRR